MNGVFPINAEVATIIKNRKTAIIDFDLFTNAQILDRLSPARLTLSAYTLPSLSFDTL